MNRLIKTSRADESVRANAAEMEHTVKTEETAEVFKVSRPGKYSNKQALTAKVKNEVSDSPSPNPPVSGMKCYNCGGPFPHSEGKPCPAKGKACNKCSKLNHFASQCRGGRRILSTRAEMPYRSALFSASATPATPDEGEQDFSHLGEVKCIGSLSTQPHLVTVQSEGGELRFNPDTGADVTLMDSDTFSKLKLRPALTASNIKLLTYGQPSLSKYLAPTLPNSVSIIIPSASRSTSRATSTREFPCSLAQHLKGLVW